MIVNLMIYNQKKFKTKAVLDLNTAISKRCIHRPLFYTEIAYMSLYLSKVIISNKRKKASDFKKNKMTLFGAI